MYDFFELTHATFGRRSLGIFKTRVNQMTVTQSGNTNVGRNDVHDGGVLGTAATSVDGREDLHVV